ncbi:universal stress protein [Kutzneria buriramensis]|uniref:Nucleotide-binding universal stress UspA family protein n=1 Tax=Kutzneria buriramensis TaxID=1045776 RepID=A0A3E0GXX2_9PSEU|nr:universal stress protein [Kutzneria buriramensis]REH34798.1 nucleotide-binding universal stress UspA family protein [Kutzneria buriramensis]
MIVVGIDGTEVSKNALEWAVREGAVRQTSVHVVHAWRYDPMTDLLPSQQIKEDSTELLAREVALVTGTPRTDNVSYSSVQGDAARVLHEVSEGADMLVLGSHQRNALGEVLLGSVSRECVRHATCPVVVVPAAGS